MVTYVVMSREIDLQVSFLSSIKLYSISCMLSATVVEGAIGLLLYGRENRVRE